MSRQAPGSSLEPVFHATVASNFARAFNKYTRVYDKAAIAESVFPQQFFVLRGDELVHGVAKATALLAKLSLRGNRVVVLRADVGPERLHANTRTGRGRYLAGSSLEVAEVFWLGADGALEATCFEEVVAAGLVSLASELMPYADLAPRTLSVLPVARACQAACRFCFSESSASLSQAGRLANVELLEQWMAPARAAGATRFVITGGGEPGLLKHHSLVELVATASKYFAKVVLITNGVHLARRTEQERRHLLLDYAEAGLTVLAISRHHPDPDINRSIMGLDTETATVLQTICAHNKEERRLTTRLICVLQRGGVESADDMRQYLGWAAAAGVDEVCFKELYVSSTLESAYHTTPENNWARANQVPLSRLLPVLAEMGFASCGALPWGAPLFLGDVAGRSLRVAAYTEPSLLWERTTGVARSWNVMADGTCLASLEDPRSVVSPPGKPSRRVFELVRR
jgi:hypothetical protein